MNLHRTAARAALALPFLLLAGAAGAQQGSDAAYIKKVGTAAPPGIVQNATIVKMANGTMQTLKQGTNGFTCMVLGGGTPMCGDTGAMEWAHAWQSHAAPPDKVGFMYMLAGDTGVSNTDPYAEKPQAGNHWVKTGPHVMILGPAVKVMAGYPRSPDPNTKEAYVMWAGTPYEHLMIPVK